MTIIRPQQFNQKHNAHPLEILRASDLAGKPYPPRKWVVPQLIPDRNVTLLGGDGGTGKSLLGLQLATGIALTGHWLGLQVEREETEDQRQRHTGRGRRKEAYGIASAGKRGGCAKELA